jgi:ectoine hydroxylase-related dioxygenase (phytanoyl-CoA dioxygenase family)
MNAHVSSNPWFATPRLGETELSFYRDQGYLLRKGLLTPAGVERMLEECMTVWHAEKSAARPGQTWLESALLGDIHHRSKVVRDYYFNGPLVDMMTQLIGPNVKGVTAQLTFKLRGNTKAFPWHQDNAYGELSPYNSVTCLTALEDNHRETGCLWIIPESHKQGQLQPGLTPAEKAALREVVQTADDSRAMPMPMAAGDCLIFSCWTLHKSEGNLSPDRDRRVLFLRYADADAVEVYNGNRPRLGRVVRGHSTFPEVEAFEQAL